MSNFTNINPNEINESPFKLIGSDWMLVTAGNEEKYNTMTASWGGVGVLWGKNVAFVFIRPQRYTKEFVDGFENFTLSFFNEDMKDALKFCGAKSGRDYDKAKETGLLPVFDNNSVYFEQAKLVLKCHKMYCQRLDKQFELDADIEKWYKDGDYHYMYIAEIENALIKE